MANVDAVKERAIGALKEYLLADKETRTAVCVASARSPRWKLPASIPAAGRWHSASSERSWPGSFREAH